MKISSAPAATPDLSCIPMTTSLSPSSSRSATAMALGTGWPAKGYGVTSLKSPALAPPGFKYILPPEMMSRKPFESRSPKASVCVGMRPLTEPTSVEDVSGGAKLPAPSFVYTSELVVVVTNASLSPSPSKSKMVTALVEVVSPPNVPGVTDGNEVNVPVNRYTSSDCPSFPTTISLLLVEDPMRATLRVTVLSVAEPMLYRCAVVKNGTRPEFFQTALVPP
mmetsp:Transcript_49265/g.110831  ORF Transcript_49265/g.110831 Transcript_49265/m.110831 type:complete len:222 (+) Transcript_49265:1281-1946(+)